MSFNPNKIWLRRHELGLSLIELSQLTGISLGGLHYIETGQKVPKVDNLLKIAKALKCSIFDFFDETELEEAINKKSLPKSVKAFVIDVLKGKEHRWAIKDLSFKQIRGLLKFEASEQSPLNF